MRQKVAAMLADYRAGQQGRLGEMRAYADTDRCRHGHISAYFGGRPIQKCASCDNCLGLATDRPRKAHPIRQPKGQEQAAEPTPAETWVTLKALTELPFPLGRRSLSRALKGTATSPVQADRFALYGALPGPTLRAIWALIDRLDEKGLLEPFEKGRYRLLRLSAKGKAWLDAHPEPPEPIPLVPQTEVRPAPRPAQGQSDTEKLTASDEALFEELRAWRWKKAKKLNYAPYVIFHDAVLRRIAAARPASLEELVAIKGIGPRKLEQYGAEVLSVMHKNQHG
jgi:ATP-dependent DNA helicase RecQ